jgi:hypothetical protein
MTNSRRSDGHGDRETAEVSVWAASVRQKRNRQLEKGAQMKYVLLNYTKPETAGERRPREMHPAVAAVLERPDVSGWVRLQPAESATTLRLESRKVLLTDGPFIDSKEFLAGLILVEAEDLDGALAVASELQELDVTAAIEVRPVLEQELGGA